MKKKFIAVLLLAMLFNMTSVSALETGFENFNWSNQGIAFADVPKDSWYYESVFEASGSGIINGVGNNLFNPNGTLTHAEAMTLMAKTYAIYHDKLNELAQAQASSMGDHWAFSILSFCKSNGLQTPGDSELDTPITRGTMAQYFYNALPSKAFDTGVSNDLALMPEATTDVTVQKLFKAGVLVGDAGGFRLQDSITRAEAAAIIQRVANPGKRAQQGEVQTDKLYKTIPNTDWSIDPTCGITVYSQSGNIKTKYGNHSYGCQNQKQYDKVMSVIDEAFLYACQEETKNSHYKDIAEEMSNPDNKMVEFYKSQVGLNNDREIVNICIAQNIVNNMRQYLADTYATPNGVGTHTDYHNNNVHKYLFSGGLLDCDGNGYLNMLCWDYLGFSTRMITSMRIAHATSQVYVNGHWIMLNQDSGKFDYCTHEQLLELISGIKNDAYSNDSDTDAMIKSASAAIDNGNISSGPNDLEIWENENPTHNPGDSSVN